MVVNFTSNIGLAKPTEAELAENWTNGPELQEDNNLIIADKMDINFNSYTPAFIGPTTNPNVGSGSILGEYYEVQGFIFGSFAINLVGALSVGSGTGAYGIALPTLVDNAFHTIGNALNNAPGLLNCIGEGYFFDASGTPASSYSCAIDAVRVGGVDYARLIIEPYGGKTVEWVGPNVPFAFQTGDFVFGQFVYKKP